MQEFERKLKKNLLERGASLVKYADLSRVEETEFPYGISIGLALPVEIVKSLNDGPDLKYYDAYHELNDRLNDLGEYAEDYLEQLGYQSFAQTTKKIKMDEKLMTPVPHKTVATRAGMGWIGKCALLVTEEYGSALRITSVLTNAPLTSEEPIDQSKCQGCSKCSRKCPAGAVSGEIWKTGRRREEFFDAEACMRKAKEITKERLGFEFTICGKCIAVCPYTEKYIKK